MSKPLQNPLHPKAAKQLESYLEELIINPTFEYEPQNDEDLGMWMWTHFVFHEPPLEKIERLIPNPDHVNGDDIESICYRVLVHLFKEKDIIRNKIPDWGEPSQMLGIYDTKDYIDNEFITIAKQILLDYLYRVPFEYTVFTPFPQDILPDFNPFVISDRMKLIKVEYDSDGKNFPPLFAEHYEFKGELLSESKKVVDYLAIKIFGSGINSHRTVFRKALGTLKIFAAALHAMGVLEYQEYGSSNTDSSDSRRNCFIYPIDEHRKPPFLQEENTSVQINENEDDWNFLNRLRLNKSCLEPNQLELIAIERGKKKNSLEEKHKRFQQKLRSVRKLFLSTSDVEKMMEINRVKNALHWFFDGIADNNASFSFIKLTIALETLLGEPSAKKDIVQRLADRCSFLIATDAVERKKIKKDFISTYDVRSKIIHEGKAQLNKNDIIHYNNMEKFVREALAREIDSLPDA
jgi:hypothetical protein